MSKLTSSSQEITIAILSDLHCHEITSGKKTRESFLIAGDPRVPSERHPIQSLIDLIDSQELRADVVICPGDLSNKISTVGFQCALQLLNEVKNNFGADDIFCTIGNHDVSSKTSGGDPFKIAKYIDPNFPFRKREDKNQFWSEGFCMSVIQDKTDFLIINTAHEHYDTASAVHGTFETKNIRLLDTYLDATKPSPLRIAVFHHHPLLHSFPFYTSRDVLPTGDQLLDVLIKNNFNIVIHGHRHEPRIRRYSSLGREMLIFCSGSFSAYLNEIYTVTRNLFHLMTIDFDSNAEVSPLVSLQSWEFNFGYGWNKATFQSAGLPYKTSGRPKSPPNLQPDLSMFLKSNLKSYIPGDELITAFPSLNNLLPDELTALQNKLLEDEAQKLEIDQFGSIIGFGKIFTP